MADKVVDASALAAIAFAEPGVLEGIGLRFRGIDQEAVVKLGLQTGLTAYDASYLWLARAPRMPLVTLDKKLGAHTAAF